MPRSTARTTPPVRGSTARRGVAALASLALLAGPASAESPPGNALNPEALDPSLARDGRGMSALVPHRRHSPSGLLYPYPRETPESQPWLGGWLYRGSLEVGGFWDTGDEEEARFERYADWPDGALVSELSLHLSHPDGGAYLDLTSGSLGRDDHFYALEAGRAGWLRVRGAFSGIPRSYANDARVLFLGLDGDSLTLPAPLVPGANAEADLAAALAGVGEHTVELQRDRSYLSLELRALPELKLRARYGFEDRGGARPFGGAFSFPNLVIRGGVSESAVPVDDRTHDVSAGLEYAGEHVQANLEYTGSFYRNRNDALVLENPFEVAAGQPAIERGRFALAPDNEAHGVRGDVALALPLRGRLTTTVSWSTRRQDEPLLPPTVNDVVLLGLVDLTEWNTTAALSRTEADAEIDTLLVDLALHLNPWRPLRLKLRARHYDQDNDTSYTAFNALAGAYGYIIEDGGHAETFGPLGTGVFEPGVSPAGSRFRYRSTPFGYDRQNYEVGASYAVAAKTTLGLRWEHERWDRDHRERDVTRENRWRASLSTRALPRVTLRAAYEYAGRDGDSLDLGVQEEFFTSSLPGYAPFFLGDPPAGLAQQPRPELSNRNQHVVDVRANLAIGDFADLALAGGYRVDAYREDYGLERERRGHGSLELGFQPSPGTHGYLYASVEGRSRDTTGIAGGFGGSDPNAGGAVYPLSRGWAADEDELSLGFGAGVEYSPLRGWRVRADYAYTATADELDVEAIGAPAETAGDLPTLRTSAQLVESNVFWDFREGWTLRVYYRLERGTVQDFHQRDLAALNGRRLFFAHVDRDYTAGVFGVALRRRF